MPKSPKQTVDTFRASLVDSAPDTAWPPALKALWHEANGDWEQAHLLVQDAEQGDQAWIHAYLHRKEGDRSNARYWYRRAGKPECTNPLEDEWSELIGSLLAKL